MQPPSLRIDQAEERLLAQWSSGWLRRYAPKGRGRRPRLLVVAPLSGHFGWLMRDTVMDLSAAHDVHLLEWRDARDIPASAGHLGLDAYIGTIMAALRHLGPGMAVLGVSQAPVPILAAAALMAAQSEPERPRTLILMGGFIDPRRNATAVERMTARLPPGWFTRTLATAVPEGEAGAGRRVYPAAAHSQALQRYLQRHIRMRGELHGKIGSDDGGDPARFPFRRLYTTLMDLPAEFAEDNARKVFAEARLATGSLACSGRLVEPAMMTDTALLTVEGAADDSSGPGHTHAAHSLCSNLPEGLRGRATLPGIGHFGLFHGETWRRQVLPLVEAFVEAQTPKAGTKSRP
ncbi:MAG TPA: polyhydroxyalkanoate depolymerase [Magnetospirillum sp.]|jgi:poly(3-hydroxybutyrate) depolymerase|nr:polyhydroxyalkanoate depolymerase [Magnetospirillum sp.]